MNKGPGTNWGAQRAEQFPHLGNYTLTPAQMPFKHHSPWVDCLFIASY